MTEQAPDTPAERWINFREDIKVFDCTIRDGGLMNNHKFDDAVVRGVYQACLEAGIVGRQKVRVRIAVPEPRLTR